MVAGLPKVIQYHMEKFSASQIRSLSWSILFVYIIVSIFFFSPFLGLLVMLPLFFTVAINFGVMGYLGIPLDAATILIGSISIGVGVDYSIHFLSRVLSELKQDGNSRKACIVATRTTEHAILVNAVTLIVGFGILYFSIFATVSAFGTLMALTMATSSVAALTVLPAILSQIGWKQAKISVKHDVSLD